jgi:hypothetical protein
MQLSRGDEDPNPIIVNTETHITSCGWNNKGTILAVTGTLRTQQISTQARGKGAKESDVDEKEQPRNRNNSDALTRSRDRNDTNEVRRCKCILSTPIMCGGRMRIAGLRTRPQTS